MIVDLEPTMRNLDWFSPEEALRMVCETGLHPVVETIHIDDATRRAVSGTIHARIALPLFDKAAVDGIGVRDGDKSATFSALPPISAGDPGDRDLEPGQCIPIMTGAPVPESVERVVRFEYTRREGDEFTIITEERATNIAYRGENISPGDVLMEPRLLRPQDIGILASQGFDQIDVARKPVVAVLATGSELHKPGSALPPGGIYDSNSYQLCAMATESGAQAVNFGIIPDDPEILKERAAEALASADFVLFSGGVSMGDRDYVPDVLADLGVATVFHGLAVKPGRPTLFGRYPRGAGSPVAVFGLPGNPVSTFVQFELLIRPLIHQALGISYQPREEELPLAADFRRRNADRHEFRPARYRNGAVELLPYKGSGHIAAMAGADIIIRIDKDVSEIPAGARVYARFIR